MPLEEFLQAIRFRFFQPTTAIPASVQKFLYRFPGMQHGIEAVSTVLPDPETRSALAKLRGIPRMTSLAVAAVIRTAVRVMPPGAAYLNVGTWHGYSLFCGMAGHPKIRCVGVDNFSEFGNPKEEFLRRFQRFAGPAHEFHAMDFERYFAEIHHGPIGCYFYDGNHLAESHRKGLALAEPHIIENGIIIIDDINGDWVREGVAQFLGQTPYRYETVCDLRTYCNRHPSWWNGLMILRKGKKKS